VIGKNRKYSLDVVRRMNFGLHWWFSPPRDAPGLPFAFAGVSLGWVSFALVLRKPKE